MQDDSGTMSLLLGAVIFLGSVVNRRNAWPPEHAVRMPEVSHKQTNVVDLEWRSTGFLAS